MGACSEAQMANLLDNPTLEQSSVVANSRMNRERRCVGANSYTKELGFNPIEFLEARVQQQGRAAWLDLCCGRGRALIDAGCYFVTRDISARVRLVGVDLVPLFEPYPAAMS